MKKLLLLLFVLFSASAVFAQEFRQISVKEYSDKMKGGWIGQIAGVCWGAPTEFKFCAEIIPEDKMPKWTPDMINNAFGQDDLYVEMTFLRSLEQYGFDVSQRQAGIDFANSNYRLWHANDAGRKNLRKGIAPPDSGHPAFNKHADDIDYQIEADYSGLVAPGMPWIAVELGNKFGGLMNYGDGLYAGQFVGGMYAEAFFETDVKKIINAGLKCIPKDSQYAEMVRDVVKWHSENPNDWLYCWNKIEEKYHNNPAYRQISCDTGKFNIDAKINGAYILVGLLYGNGDLDKTIILSTRCGQDSDCNPSSAGGVLFTTLGFSQLPPRFSEKLDNEKKFSYTEYNFPALLDVCEKIARQAVLTSGGKVITKNGEEYFQIPKNRLAVISVRNLLRHHYKTVSIPMQVEKYTPSWKAEPPKNTTFSEDELKQIAKQEYDLAGTVEKLFSGWKILDCGPDMEPGYREEYSGKQNVLMTHPKAKGEPCILTKTVELPKDKKSTLKLTVAAHDTAKKEFDWELIVKANGKELLKKQIIGNWQDITVDLSEYAGQKVKLELLNQPNGWACEAGYWGKITVE